MSMSHRDVAQAFANGATKGTGSRMFIEGDQVFSHGRHYPIAKRYFKDDIDYLFNTPYGSSSTASHCGYVRGAISGNNVLVVKGCDMDNASVQLQTNERDISQAKAKKAKARKESMIERWQERINELEAQNELLSTIAAKRRLLQAAEREMNGNGL